MEEKKQEKERREKEAQEAEIRKQEEETNKKKKRKEGKDPKDGKKSQAAGKAGDSKSQDRVTALKSQEGKKHTDSDHQIGKSNSGTERPDSHMTERGESAMDGEGK